MKNTDDVKYMIELVRGVKVTNVVDDDVFFTVSKKADRSNLVLHGWRLLLRDVGWEVEQCGKNYFVAYPNERKHMKIVEHPKGWFDVLKNGVVVFSACSYRIAQQYVNHPEWFE